jgi:hypothetical protein
MKETKNKKKQQYRMVNIDKSCFDNAKNYCDSNGLKLSPFISSAINKTINDSNSETNPFRMPLKISTDNINASLRLHRLYYDILDINKNLEVWVNNIVCNKNLCVGLNLDPNKGVISFKYLNITKKSFTQPHNPGYYYYIDNETGQEYQSHEVMEFERNDVYGTDTLSFKDMVPPVDSENYIGTVKRLCRILENALRKAGTIHLYATGYRSDDLDFLITINKEWIKTLIDEIFSLPLTSKFLDTIYKH